MVHGLIESYGIPDVRGIAHAKAPLFMVVTGEFVVVHHRSPARRIDLFIRV